MKVPGYDKQTVKPQNYNTIMEQPDYSGAIKMQAAADIIGQGVKTVGNLAIDVKNARRNAEYKDLQFTTKEQLSSIGDEINEMLNKQEDYDITQNAEEFFNTKQQAVYSQLSKKVKDPILRRNFQNYWRSMAQEMKGVVSELGEKRTLQLLSLKTGRNLAKAEQEGDLEEIREIINIQAENGLIKPENIGKAYEDSRYRMGLNSTWETLSQLDYEQGLNYLSRVQNIKQEDRVELEKRYKNTWGLRNAAKKERLDNLKTEITNEYLQRMLKGDLSPDDIVSDSRLDEIPEVKEKWINKIEQRAKSGLSGDKDPNKQTDKKVFSEVLSVVNDPKLTTEEKVNIVMEKTGVDENGNPQLSITKGESLLKEVRSGKYEVGKKNGIDYIKGYTSKEISATNRDSKKLELKGKEADLLLEYEKILSTGDYTAEEQLQIAQNLVAPIKQANIKAEMVKNDKFMDFMGSNNAEDFQTAIQENKLLGVQDQYTEQLTELYKGQQRLFAQKMKQKPLQIATDPNGQFMMQGTDKKWYRFVVKNKNEVLEIYNGKDWEAVK